MKRTNIHVTIEILILIAAAVLIPNSAIAAKDFIVENKTSALFIINGTTGNIILAPSFGMVGIGTVAPINALTVIGSVSAFGSLNATFINATEIRIGNSLVPINGAFNNGNYTALEDSAFKNVNFSTQLNNYIPSFFNNENFTNLKPFTLANYSTEYASTGFKIINFTNNYDNRADRFGNANYSSLAPFTLANYSSEYASSGFKSANFTTNYEAQAYFKIANYTALENAAFTNANYSNLNNSLWNLSRNLILYPKDAAFLIRIGDVNRNISNDTFAVIGSAAVYGSLNSTSFNSSFILQNNNQVQTINAVFNNVNYTALENAAFTNTNYTNLEAAAFNKANYSTEYSSSGFKISNYTALENAAFNLVNYSAEYASTGYKLANFTSNLNAQNGSLWNRSSAITYLKFIDDLIGIGTITPDNRLTIRGTDADANLAGQPGLLHLNITDSYNASTTNLITLDHNLNNPGNSTGGIGIGILFRAVNNDSELVNVSFINASLVNARNGSEASALSFYTRAANGLLTPKLILNGSDVFIGANAATGGAITVLNSGSVGIGTTGPQNKLEVIGAATFAGGVNASSLNVTGFSITDDSLVTLSDGSKKKIKDIAAGEEVLTLDEKTGKLVPRKVNALLDHGIKPIYEMATEDGRAINTTAEHPYFVRIYKNSKSSGRSLITLPLNASGECSFSNLDIVRFCVSKSFARILNSQIPKCSEDVNCSSVKCLSRVINNLCSDKVSSKTPPFSMPLGDNLTSCPDFDKKENNPLCTFSSNKNFILSRDKFETSFCELDSKFQSSFNMLFTQGGISFKDFFMSSAIFEHFQNYGSHDSCAFESWLAMANVGVNDDELINFGSHKVADGNEVYKDYGEWGFV